ncbi:hypothetical protein KY290_032697 [Solanum tuberosum]|uniref:Uncharacterized protein n=1 Tax=Solanum tuberosum TaxID=4113 RepID=A0ABQ7UDE1_SOLTU|nr:hypothetical protein KY290_032697 [Solanum tuberosum]
MSSVTSEYCRDDISGYACSNMSYEHDKHEFCEGYDGPYEHGNGALAYDDDSYEGYDCPWDNEQHGGENYYSGDDFEMNGTYDSCDDVEGNLDRNGSCEVEFPSSSCATSYPKKEGIDVWAGPFQSHHVAHRSNTFTTSQNMITFSSHPSSNVSCSPFGDEVGGRVGGTLSHEVVELRESFTALREDFDDFLRMFEKVKSMVQKRQVIHHEDKPKELPLEAKQDAPYKGDVKELNMEVKTPTPYAPKWKLNLKNQEVLESFQKEQMCSNVDNQGEDTSSYELQGNNANSYTSLNLEHHCVASSPLSVNDSLSICEHSETLPSDVLDSTLYDDNILVMSEQILVDPIDDRIAPYSKDNLLFDDVMTLESVHSEMPYNVGTVATLGGYQLFENPLWCDDTLSKDVNLFFEDDSTFIGVGSVKMKWDAYVLIVTSFLCVPILHMSCDSLVYKVEAKLGNTLIEVHLCDTFLYYLFAYDDTHAFEWSMFLEDKSANRAKKSVLDPCSWISFPFDLGNELNCGTCVVMLGQDDKHNLGELVGTFLYDRKYLLRVYNQST